MRNRSALKIIIAVLVIVFSLKALSEIFFIKAIHSKDVNLDLIKISTQIYPISSDYFFRYGSILLTKYSKENNEEILEESRKMFRRSLSLNNLKFPSHFLLGRSYLANNSTDPSEFEKGLKFIKNASSIRNTNLGINVDTIKIYLSLWPFIGKEDRGFVERLVKISMRFISKDDFEGIMEAWGFYSQDASFLSAVSTEYGKYKFIILRELLKHELHIEYRYKLLAQHEYFIFSEYEKQKVKIRNNEKLYSDLYLKVSSMIRGYYKFNAESKFRETLWDKLKKELLEKTIKLNLKNQNDDNIQKIIFYSKKYLSEFKAIQNVESLDELLSQKKFFNSNDIKVFYLKQLINFNTGQISKMINEIEGFRQSVSFVREGQKKNLGELLTLLADAYISSRLLTKAMDILKEVDKVSPGLISTYWRLMKIENVIGEDDLFKESKAKKFFQIRNSNNLVINKTNIKTEVYPFEVDKLSLNLDENFVTTFREHHLLQVFVNNKIFYESYIGELKFPVDIPIPVELRKEKFDVEINLVK